MSFHDKFPAYGGRGPLDVRLGVGLAITATIFLALRVYVRLRVNKFGTTALLLSLLAWLLTIITQVFGIFSVYHGLGNHISIIVQTGELHNFLLYTWVTVFFFNLAIPTGKVAVAAFLIEMNGQGNPKIRRSLLAVAILNIIANIPQCLLVWLQCSPVDALWDVTRQDKCDHRLSVYYTYFVGAIAALTDFYFAIVPIHMLLPLRIDPKLKWGLSFLMGCGIFAGVAAIVRTWAAKYILSQDSSYGVGILFLWGEVEEWVVLITMSIPPIWPLFRPYTSRFVKSSLSRSNRSNRRGYNSPCSCDCRYHSHQPQSASVVSDQSRGFRAPLVTTTILVSSSKNDRTGPGQSESSSRVSDDKLPALPGMVKGREVRSWF